VAGRAKFHLSRADFVSGDALAAGCDLHSWFAAKGRAKRFTAWQEPRPPDVVCGKKGRAKFHLSRLCFVSGDALAAGCDLHSWLAAKREGEKGYGSAGAAPSRCCLR
jgi:hypothetical protein